MGNRTVGSESWKLTGSENYQRRFEGNYIDPSNLPKLDDIPDMETGSSALSYIDKKYYKFDKDKNVWIDITSDPQQPISATVLTTVHDGEEFIMFAIGEGLINPATTPIEEAEEFGVSLVDLSFPIGSDSIPDVPPIIIDTKNNLMYTGFYVDTAKYGIAYRIEQNEGWLDDGYIEYDLVDNDYYPRVLISTADVENDDTKYQYVYGKFNTKKNVYNAINAFSLEEGYGAAYLIDMVNGYIAYYHDSDVNNNGPTKLSDAINSYDENSEWATPSTLSWTVPEENVFDIEAGDYALFSIGQNLCVEHFTENDDYSDLTWFPNNLIKPNVANVFSAGVIDNACFQLFRFDGDAMGYSGRILDKNESVSDTRFYDETVTGFTRVEYDYPNAMIWFNDVKKTGKSYTYDTLPSTPNMKGLTVNQVYVQLNSDDSIDMYMGYPSGPNVHWVDLTSYDRYVETKPV